MTYIPPWQNSTAPWYRGYTIMSRGAGKPFEIWHYRSDTLKHVAKTWAAAKAWADENPAIPASGVVSRNWNHLALY